MEAIKNFFVNYVWTPLSSIGISDVFDMLLLALILFLTFRFIRKRRAVKLIIGILLLLAMLLIARLTGLVTINFFLSNFFEVGVIALIILFQPELRSALEKVGSEPGRRFKQIKVLADSDLKIEIVNCICTAVVQMSKEKTGALIVIERGTKLGEHINSGTIVNAEPSVKLIQNIFYKNSPLHDGALIIRDNRLYAAACLLPISSSDNPEYSDLGTRHHAALGVSEVSDAVVIVVSEQTGIISIAQDGVLDRNFNSVTLKKSLYQRLFNVQEDENKHHVKNKAIKDRKSKKKNKSAQPENESPATATDDREQ